MFGQSPQPGADQDWAVFGTNATDGPLRLPYGGDFGQLANRFPLVGLPATLSVQPKLIDNGAGPGGKLHMAYPQRVAALDPLNGKTTIRAETPTPQAAESQRKTAGYAVPLWFRYAQPIRLANGQLEVMANQGAEGDKNALFRRFHLLRYDQDGNLLHDAPVNFSYNRDFFARCPLVDAEGRVVGVVNVFGDGDGKKEFMDPDDNRVAVVVTDANGAVWSQFDWVVNGGSMRAAFPLFACQEGETIRLLVSNGQKMLKPTYETWAWTRQGNTVNTSMLAQTPETGLFDTSTKLGIVNNGETPGWYSIRDAQLLHGFTDEKGTRWMIQQRVTSTYDNGSLTSRIFGDLFVQQYDSELRLQKQTVVAMANKAEPARIEPLLRYPDGATYAVLQGADTELLRFRSTKSPVVESHVLIPNDCVSATFGGRPNYVFDPATGRLSVVCRISKTPSLGRLVQYDLK